MTDVMEEMEREFRKKVFDRLCEIWNCGQEEAEEKLKELIDLNMSENSSLTYEQAENIAINDIINEKDDKQLDFLWFEYCEHRKKAS